MAAGILAYEVSCENDQLLSSICDEWIETHPILTRAVIAAIAVHLANAVPPRYDIAHRIFTGLRSLRGLPLRFSSPTEVS